LLAEYQREYTDFNRSLNRETYLHYSGQKEDFDLERIYDRYSDLFTKDAIDRLRQQHDRIPVEFETDRRAVSHLSTFGQENYLEAQVKNLTAEIAEQESAAKFDWDGGSVEFHRSAVLLRNEPDADRRRRLYDKRSKTIAAGNGLREERLGRIYDSVKMLGYDGYIPMCQNLYGVDYPVLNQQWQRFLEETDELYTIHLRSAVLRELNIPFERAHRADVGYLGRLTGYDHYFPKNHLMRMYRQTLAGLGIDIDLQKNIRIDSDERPRKNPRAFCAPVEIPAEVMLVILPTGGQGDYQAFLHESGHAQHFGFSSGSLRAEFRYSGDRALSEMYAFLFQYLTTDPEWLQSMLGMREPQEFVRVMLLDKLMMLRRYAGKLDYELRLHSNSDLSSNAGGYVEKLTRSTLFQYEPEEYLADVDDGFYSADYLRAWAFEVMLRDYLRTKYGRAWWRNHRAGDLLKEMWNTGNRYRPDELIDQVGAGKHSLDPLIDEFLTGLK
jgi:hypothetical protein